MARNGPTHRVERQGVPRPVVRGDQCIEDIRPGGRTGAITGQRLPVRIGGPEIVAGILVRHPQIVPRIPILRCEADEATLRGGRPRKIPGDQQMVAALHQRPLEGGDLIGDLHGAREETRHLRVAHPVAGMEQRQRAVRHREAAVERDGLLEQRHRLRPRHAAITPRTGPLDQLAGSR